MCFTKAVFLDNVSANPVEDFNPIKTWICWSKVCLNQILSRASANFSNKKKVFFVGKVFIKNWVWLNQFCSKWLSLKRYVNARQCLCGSVAKAVASYTRGPRFKSSLWHLIRIPTYRTFVYFQLNWKNEFKKKSPWMAYLMN